MKRILIIFLLCIPFFLYTQSITLSINDFQVESDNPAYKYLGKGLSLLLASELQKSSFIHIVERDQLTQIIKEQQFSLSDLTDETKQIQIGRMLSAEYLVIGTVVDMGEVMLFSLRLVDTTTTAVRWQDTITEKLGVYDYIGAYFASSIITEFNKTREESIVIEETITAKIEKKEEKQETAIVKLSEGIDAYDRGDDETAKKVLAEVKTIEPVSEVSAVAAYYLSKLTTNTTKFRILTEAYYSYENPAFLGIMRTDRLHWLVGMDMSDILAPLLFGTEHAFLPVPGYPDLTLREQDARILFLGYYFPLGSQLGLGVESLWAMITNEVESDDGAIESIRSRRLPLGGIISAGYKIIDALSVGVGVSLFNQTDFGYNPENIILPLAYGVNAGLLIRNRDESFIFDTRAGYSSASTDLIDPENETISETISAPLYWENSFTFALNEKRSFFVLKQVNDFGLGRDFYYGRLLPAFEHFFLDNFSLRLGLEGALVNLDNVQSWGYGVLMGSTFIIPKIGLDLNINLAYRQKPSRTIAGMMIPQFILITNFNWNDVFISREE